MIKTCDPDVLSNKALYFCIESEILSNEFLRLSVVTIPLSNFVWSVIHEIPVIILGTVDGYKIEY